MFYGSVSDIFPWHREPHEICLSCILHDLNLPPSGIYPWDQNSCSQVGNMARSVSISSVLHTDTIITSSTLLHNNLISTFKDALHATMLAIFSVILPTGISWPWSAQWEGMEMEQSPNLIENKLWVDSLLKNGSWATDERRTGIKKGTYFMRIINALKRWVTYNVDYRNHISKGASNNCR